MQELEFEELSKPTFHAAPARGERDYVALIESAYDLASDDRSWLSTLAHVAFPILDRGSGVSSFFWDLSEAGKYRVRDATFVGCAPELHVGFRAGAARLTLRQARDMYVQGHPCKVIDNSVQYPRAYAAYNAHLPSVGFLVLSSAGFDGKGCSIAAPLATETPLAPALARALDQVARHIAAGMRLRRALRGASTEPAPDAVLDSRGRLLHSEPQVAAQRERGGIVDAARRLLESRRVRRSRPEQAVELWRGLVLGRWSLVDHKDSDGKRFLLARQNAPVVREPAALSAEERRAAALFSLLGSVKLVAYELGLAPSTISQALKSASRKLGCRNRAELAALLQPDPSGPKIHE